MEESKDLKTGDTTSYEIGGKTVKLKPATLGKMKKAMAAFTMAPGQTMDTFDMIQNHLTEILSNGENDFVTKDWIADNITLPMANKMIDDMRAINGLEKRDFLKKGAAETGKVTRDLDVQLPTPSA